MVCGCVCVCVCMRASSSMHVCICSVYIQYICMCACVCVCACVCWCTLCSMLLMSVLYFEPHRSWWCHQEQKCSGTEKECQRKRTPQWRKRTDYSRQIGGKNGHYHTTERSRERTLFKKKKKIEVEKKAKNRGNLTSSTSAFSARQATAFLVHTNQCRLNTRNAA